MYLITTPWWLRILFPKQLTWQIPTKEKEIFLTFDDGPHPSVTPFVLDCLKKYRAKATFFCIGKNVQLYPNVYRRVTDEGHAVGNHTYNHVNGWKTGDAVYVENICKAAKAIDSNLLRPPYGKIKKTQAKQLMPQFKIIMWNVLSGDFDVNLSPQQCFKNVVSNTTAGSIIVFHDSEKAFPRLEFVLPKALKFFVDKGYTMKALPSP